MKNHYDIYFPAVRAKYAWSSLQVDNALRSRVLEEQYRARHHADETIRAARCTCPGAPPFYIRRCNNYLLARYPGSAPLHSDNCVYRDIEPRPPSRQVDAIRLGQFSALLRNLSDPTLTPEKRAARKLPEGSRTLSKTHKRSVAIYTLAQLAWERSGLTQWQPQFASCRGASLVDHLWGIGLQHVCADDPALANFLGQFEVCAWSRLKSQQKALCWGSVIGTAGEPQGVRMTLAGRPDLSLIMPLSRERSKGSVSEMLLQAQLMHPVWICAVAQRFEDEWKAHHLACFRLHPETMMPVDSGFEAELINRLVEQRRRFRRWLVPPDDSKFVPDFELLDTGYSSVYIEVAGLRTAEYRERLEQKVKRWGTQLLIWDAEIPLENFVLPPVKKMPVR